jgi:glucose-1-phosphatase
MKRIRQYTIIFDLGNVILNFDHNIICDKLSKICGLKSEVIYSKIFKSGLEKEFDEGILSPEKFLQKCSSAMRCPLEEKPFKKIWCNIFIPNENVINLIKKLRTNYEIFLLSNTNQWHYNFIKMNFDIFKLFGNLILSFQIGCTKPDSRIFKYAANCSTSFKIIYIDDIIDYVHAAKKEGFIGIHYQNFDKLILDLIKLEVL